MKKQLKIAPAMTLLQQAYGAVALGTYRYRTGGT